MEAWLPLRHPHPCQGAGSWAPAHFLPHPSLRRPLGQESGGGTHRRGGRGTCSPQTLRSAKVFTQGAERVTRPVTPSIAHTLFSSRTKEMTVVWLFFKLASPKEIFNFMKIHKLESHLNVALIIL